MSGILRGIYNISRESDNNPALDLVREWEQDLDLNWRRILRGIREEYDAKFCAGSVRGPRLKFSISLYFVSLVFVG